MKRNDNVFNGLLVEIGNQLAELRIKKGYPTLNEFVNKYDLPQVQYWRIEKGKANVTLRSLSKILNIHRVSLQEFFCLITSEKLAA